MYLIAVFLLKQDNYFSTRNPLCHGVCVRVGHIIYLGRGGGLYDVSEGTWVVIMGCYDLITIVINRSYSSEKLLL